MDLLEDSSGCRLEDEWQVVAPIKARRSPCCSGERCLARAVAEAEVLVEGGSRVWILDVFHPLRHVVYSTFDVSPFFQVAAPHAEVFRGPDRVKEDGIGAPGAPVLRLLPQTFSTSGQSHFTAGHSRPSLETEDVNQLRDPTTQ